jgi:acetyl esterase
VTAECDPLRDEAESYGRRLIEAGVPVTMHRYRGMVHGFVGLAGLRASDDALTEIADAVRNAVAPR